MKARITAFIIITLVSYTFTKHTHAQCKEGACVGITVAVKQDTLPVKNALVELSQGKVELWSDYTDSSGTFLYTLDRNSNYTIVVKKNGYSTQYVDVSTILPGNPDEYPFHIVDINIDMKRSENKSQIINKALKFDSGTKSFALFAQSK